MSTFTIELYCTQIHHEKGHLLLSVVASIKNWSAKVIQPSPPTPPCSKLKRNAIILVGIYPMEIPSIIHRSRLPAGSRAAELRPGCEWNPAAERVDRRRRRGRRRRPRARNSDGFVPSFLSPSKRRTAPTNQRPPPFLFSNRIDSTESTAAAAFLAASPPSIIAVALSPPPRPPSLPPPQTNRPRLSTGLITLVQLSNNRNKGRHQGETGIVSTNTISFRSWEIVVSAREDVPIEFYLLFKLAYHIHSHCFALYSIVKCQITETAKNKVSFIEV